MENNEKETMHNIVIEPVGLSDLDAIVKVQQASWQYTYPSPENGVTQQWVDEFTARFNTEHIKDRLKTYDGEPGNMLYIVAKQSTGSVCGFLYADKNGEYNELRAIYIDPKYIGKGVGALLMQEFIDWSLKDKSSRLDVVSYNDRAIGFYEHYGFKKTSKKIPPYFDVMPSLEMIRPAI